MTDTKATEDGASEAPAVQVRMGVLSSPAVASIDPAGSKRAIFVGGSVTNRGTGRNEAVVFRLEDAVPVD